MSRKRLIGAAILALILSVGAAAYGWWGARGAVAGYRLAKVERGAITAVVSVTGTLNPVVSVQVGSQVSGQIKEILVDFNSQVRKGQVIARIDPDSFTLKVNQAMADLEAARATVLTQRANVSALEAEVSRARVSLADAEREFQRNQVLHEKSFVSAAALDKAKFAFRAAQEQVRVAQAQRSVGESQVSNVQALVKQREAQLAQAKVDLDRTTIRAPVDGIVVKKSVEPGQTVAASLQAPELFVIAQDLRQMQVDASIDEAEVGRVREGQQATFTVDSFPGRVFRGTVGQVRKSAQVVQNVVTYTAVIAASNPNQELFPGMTANVRIVVDTRPDAIRVPNAALRFRPAGLSDPREAGPAVQDGALPQGGGAQKGEALLERLTRELKLSPDQRSRVESIQNETRDRIRAIATQDKGERRRQAGRLRADSRARIAELLTAEQRQRYEEIAPARGGGGQPVTSGRVWILDDRGRPRPVGIRVGLADGSYSELVGGELQAGTSVIVGTRTDGKAARVQPKGGPRFGL